MRHALLFWLCIVSCAWAEQSWPERVADAHFVEVQTKALPSTLRETLLGYDEFAQDTGKLPDSLFVCRVDLNHDHQDEFIVQSNQGYSGGPQMYVFERRKQEFVRLAILGGGIYFGPRYNGYLQIVSESRSGGTMITRSLMRYQRDRYHLVRLADYRVLEPNDKLEFVQERDPKPFDQ